jgi:hypothetical protein
VNVDVDGDVTKCYVCGEDDMTNSLNVTLRRDLYYYVKLPDILAI